MGAGKILSDDLEKVLGLLEYRFDVRQASNEISDLKNKVEISIEFEDLKKGGLEFDSFVKALHILVGQFPEIEITYVSDFMQEISQNSFGIRTRDLLEIEAELHGISFKSTLADLIVPLDFNKFLKKARGDGASKSTHIVIDDTPEGANWPSLQLRFTTGRTLLAVIPLQNWHSDVIDRAQLGLDKKKGGWAKEPWKLLEEASKHNGWISLTSSKGVNKESKRRQINTLQKLLKAVLPKLIGEPLESRGVDGYQTMFEILPEQHEEGALQE
mgnify:CR=1 FL=1